MKYHLLHAVLPVTRGYIDQGSNEWYHGKKYGVLLSTVICTCMIPTNTNYDARVQYSTSVFRPLVLITVHAYSTSKRGHKYSPLSKHHV